MRPASYFEFETPGLDTIDQGWPDIFAYGPNFIKILYCGPQIFFGFKYDMIDVNLGYFCYKNS